MKDLISVKKEILKKVTLQDVMRELSMITGDRDEEQYSCSFHGVDRKKSARYYKETDTAYCWACHKRWDLFDFIREKENFTFKETIEYLIKRYRVNISHLPDMVEHSLVRYREDSVKKVQSKLVDAEKLKGALVAIRDEVDFEKYKKLVFGYMLLRYRTPEENFQKSVEKLREGILKVIKESSNDS